MKKPIWIPSEQYIKSSVLYGFQQYVEQNYNRCFLDYTAFHRWSIDQPENLWQAVLTYFHIDFSGTYDQVLKWNKQSDSFMDVHWFDGISLSYAQHIFQNKEPHKIALKYADEKLKYREVTWQELQDKVSVIQ